MSMLTERSTLVAAIAGLAIVLGAFVAVPGLYNIDETIYYLAADALLHEGSLTVRNGFETYGAEGLKLLYLVDGPRGLTPQYPVGPTLLGAPLMALLGVRGLILVNALSAVATLLLTRALARRLGYGEAAATGAVLILLFGTFFVEYAYSVRPHVLQMALVLAALWAAAGCVLPGAAAPRRDALLSGLCIGIGMMVRLETVLLLPGIGALAILYAPMPVRTLALGAAGLAPGLLASAAVNAYKFGSWNPLSYGSVGGGTDPRSYLVLLPVAVLAPLALIIFRRIEWRPGMRWPVLGGAAVALGTAAFLPALQEPLFRYLRGLYTLMIDMTVSPINRTAIEVMEDGTMTFYGLWQKALGQSLPWLGAFALLAVRPWGERRPAFLLIGLTWLFWTMPFAMLTWNGGMGGNMRYFLPLLPLLAIVLAGIWSDLLGGRPRSLMRDLMLGAGLAAVLVQAWMMLSASGFGGVQQILSVYALAALAVASLATGLGLLAARHARLMLATCFALAMIQCLGIDLAVAQMRRADTLQTDRILARLPSPALLVGPPEFFTIGATRSENLMAVPRWTDSTLQTGLYARAREDGYRVYTFKQIADDNGLATANPPVETPFGEVVELTTQDIAR